MLLEEILEFMWQLSQIIRVRAKYFRYYVCFMSIFFNQAVTFVRDISTSATIVASSNGFRVCTSIATNCVDRQNFGSHHHAMIEGNYCYTRYGKSHSSRTDVCQEHESIEKFAYSKSFENAIGIQWMWQINLNNTALTSIWFHARNTHATFLDSCNIPCLPTICNILNKLNSNSIPIYLPKKSATVERATVLSSSLSPKPPLKCY